MVKSIPDCKYCLRLLTIGATSNSCGKGRYIPGNGRNTSCINLECDNNVTLCKRHEGVNKERHRLYKNALRWAQRVRPAQNSGTIEEESFFMVMVEETETRGLAELDDMVETRKQIHLKQGADVSDIFGYQKSEHSSK